MTLTCLRKQVGHTFPNQKPQVNKSIRDALRSRTAALYNTGLPAGNVEKYEAESYYVRRAAEAAKRRYGRKLQSQLEQLGSWRD